MHPLITSELGCFHERDVRWELAAARGERGPGRRRRRGVGAVALTLLLLLALAGPALANEQRLGFAGDDALGLATAVQGNTLVLGAPFDAKHRGAAYVFERTGDEWRQTGKLTASDGAESDQFGASVALDGDTVVVGAPITPRSRARIRARPTRSPVRATPSATR